jgi:hypothetical protein
MMGTSHPIEMKACRQKVFNFVVYMCEENWKGDLVGAFCLLVMTRSILIQIQFLEIVYRLSGATRDYELSHFTQYLGSRHGYN